MYRFPRFMQLRLQPLCAFLLRTETRPVASLQQVGTAGELRSKFLVPGMVSSNKSWIPQVSRIHNIHQTVVLKVDDISWMHRCYSSNFSRIIRSSW